MPPKKSTPPPIDRPLSKAYLRQFTGWSTAFPPGLSEPNSLRLMENMMVDRNGALAVRPGLHYLNFEASPNRDQLDHDSPGVATDHPVVGSFELFYDNEGHRCLLYAVRMPDKTVQFRVMMFCNSERVDADLKEAGFSWLGGDAPHFGPGTRHVTYLQIDNKILALSDSDESSIYFNVGAQKTVKKLQKVDAPLWTFDHAPDAFHPDAAWINRGYGSTRTNLLPNPSFELGPLFWSKSENCGWSFVQREDKPYTDCVEIRSLPVKHNLMPRTLKLARGQGDLVRQTTDGWSPCDNMPEIFIADERMMIRAPAGPVAPAHLRNDDLWMVESPLMTDFVEEGRMYSATLVYSRTTENITPMCALVFYAANGAQINPRNFNEFSRQPGTIGKWFVTPPVQAPIGAVAARLYIGYRLNKPGEEASMGILNVMVIFDGDDRGGFFDGGWPNPALPTYYYWTGKPYESSSVYHPRQTIEIVSDKQPIKPGDPLAASIQILQQGDSRESGIHCELKIRLFDGSGTGYTESDPEAWVLSDTAERRKVTMDALDTTNWVTASLVFTAKDVPTGVVIHLDDAMLESDSQAITGGYFDGDTPDTALIDRLWIDPSAPHACMSEEWTYERARGTLAPEVPSADTLVSSDASKNVYKMAFFYTFENEIGESAPSMVSVPIHIQRDWSNWLMMVPDENGKPTTPTDKPELAADQIVVRTSETAYDLAVSQGALRWNLYAMVWSDQDPAPLSATLIAVTEMVTGPTHIDMLPKPWSEAGYYVVTPRRDIYDIEVPVPTATDFRDNFSQPPKHRTGTVAADRMILVGDPDDLAQIAWSSGAPGEYLNFTAWKGGGLKTLSSGNLNRPSCVELWQNPQSVDTLTVLCSGDDGRSTAYYMTPAVVQGQQGNTRVMGFEETSNTPGTMSSWGAEILNNALYRPTDTALVKSTASNYNINHKAQSDPIANMWWTLQTKQWIMSAQLDNRLYYLVNNPFGAPLERDCHGNEIWVFDTATEGGTWSRFLVQGAAMHIANVGQRTYMAVSRNDGVYYLDPAKVDDDFVDADGIVRQRPIPWRFETNTQGANRAHDAWAHLQQVSVVLGNFIGRMKYGIRGQSSNGRMVNAEKDLTIAERSAATLTWDVEDHLLVRRDMKEWAFYAESIPGELSHGQVNLVQYRYTPVSVNIGYEYGSVETFEYGAGVGGPGDVYSRNGVPLPYIDYGRP